MLCALCARYCLEFYAAYTRLHEINSQAYLMNHNPNAFVLMPFAPEFDDVYEYLIKGALSEAGFNVLRADDIRSQRNILADIVGGIFECDLIVADLSTTNPNVYYELGLAHALAKPVILLTQEIDEVPFDLRSYRILPYTTHFSRINEAKEELYELAKGAREKKTIFSNPVSDFTKLSGIDISVGHSVDGRHVRDVERSEKGLLDFQAEIEDGFEIISSILQEVGVRFNVLAPEVAAAVEQIERNANASKRRLVVRALASSMDEYAKWLQQGNATYRQSLGQVSEGLDAIFSGEFEAEGPTVSELQEFVMVLKEVEAGAVNGQEAISALVTTIDGLPRIEREFNRAKRNISDELKELVKNVDQTIAVLARARNAAILLFGVD